jgi:hypothetical protein
MSEPVLSRRHAALCDWWPVFLAFTALACTTDDKHTEKPSVDASVDASHADFVDNQRIFYTDGLHNENTVLSVQGGRLLLAFRGGESGQIGSGQAHINVYASQDLGKTFQKQAEVNADSLPDGRDIRDPKIVNVNGRLFLYAISRLPGGHYRDLGGQAWTVRSESTDGGKTWSAPEKTFADIDASGTETFWGFWRFTERVSTGDAGAEHTLYATGYDDGDTTVGLFASPDGITWTKRAIIMDSSDDVPSEAELQFFGDDADTAVAVVRLDNQGLLENGQSAICTSKAPFVTWECGRRIEQRLDGPTWHLEQSSGASRSFFFARKHLPCTRKRTAIYELRGDLADPSSPVEVCEIQEVKSAGDTSYTGLASVGDNRYLLSWYSSAVDQDVPWLEGTYSPSDIWLADVDLSAAPATCTHPQPKVSCQPPPLPTAPGNLDFSGHYLLALGPVIWPSELVLFDAAVTVNGKTLDLTLQPLDQKTRAPAGQAWSVQGVPLAADGTFTAAFGVQNLPEESYPRLADPLLTVHDFTLTGKSTSGDAFCGDVNGYTQVFGTSVADQIRLEGSTFGAVRTNGDAYPDPVNACGGSR